MSTNLSSLLRNASGSAVLPVTLGGTGQSALTLNNVLLGNGTNGLQVIAPSTSGNVLISNGTTWTSSAFTPNWLIQSSSFTATANSYILADTSSGAFTITLPASPATNNFVTIADYNGTFGTNNLTVNSNSLNLMGSIQTLVMNVSNKNVTLVYTDATRGWIITF